MVGEGLRDGRKRKRWLSSESISTKERGLAASPQLTGRDRDTRIITQLWEARRNYKTVPNSITLI